MSYLDVFDVVIVGEGDLVFVGVECCVVSGCCVGCDWWNFLSVGVGEVGCGVWSVGYGDFGEDVVWSGEVIVWVSY